MKRVISFIALILILIGLSGCYTSTFNPLPDEDFLVYENQNKSVRLEIGMKTYSAGRLYIWRDDIIYSFIVVYNFVEEFITVNIKEPELEDSIFDLKVSFKSVNFFKTDYDEMYLKDAMIHTYLPGHEIFSEFDDTLNRVYDEEVHPLNYFYNNWESKGQEILFVNDDFFAFYNNKVNGTIGEEKVWISFLDETFEIWSEDSSSVILSGLYSFDDLDLILEPYEYYTGYPSVITLNFINPWDA